MTERWLVTGGAGFIGSHIVEDLVRRGHSVRVFDDFSAGKLENLAPVKGRVEVVEGDLRDFAAVRRAMKGVEFVSHQGALRAVEESMQKPGLYSDINVTGTVHVLQAAKEAGARRVVFASSSSVYGDAKKFPQRETHTPAPVSPYAASKLAGEEFCALYTRGFGLETVALRYFNAFGPKQDPASQYAVVIPSFILSALQGKPLEVHWDGKQSRDFAYVGNIVLANWLASRAKGAPGKVFNVGSGTVCSLLSIIGTLETLSGRKLQRKHSPKRSGDVRRTWADISQTRRVIGYKPAVSVEEGVRRTWEYFRAATLRETVKA